MTGVPVRGAGGGSEQHTLSVWRGYDGIPFRDNAPTPRDIHERATLQGAVALAQLVAARLD